MAVASRKVGAARVKLNVWRPPSNARQSIQRYIRSHARLRSMPTLLDPRLPCFRSRLQKRANERAQIFRKSARNVRRHGAARMHDNRSRTLFDRLLSGKNPPWGMTGGSRKTSPRVAAEGLRRPLQVERTGEIVRSGCDAAAPFGNPNHKDERVSNKVRQNSYALVPAPVHPFESTKMRDGQIGT